MIDGVYKVSFPIHGDEKGSLIAIEGNKNIDFTIERVYYIFDTSPNVVRGKHAHRDLKQLLICMHGSCDILMDNGLERETITLTGPDKGLYISGFVWREMSNFSQDCVLMVLASKKFDTADYVYDYDEVLQSALQARVGGERGAM